MGWFKNTVHYTCKGSYLAFETTGWDGELTSVSIENDTREALDVTHTRSPDGYREFVPGGFVTPGTLTVTLTYDANNPPPVDRPREPMRLVLAKENSTDQFVLGGDGFLTEGGGGDLPEGGGLGTSTFTVHRSSKWTPLQAEPLEAL